MQDSELPVRVDSVFALRSFIEACKGGFYSFVLICDCIDHRLFYTVNIYTYLYFTLYSSMMQI
jgi:hypothetical protein